MTWDQDQVESLIKSSNWTNFEKKIGVCTSLFSSEHLTNKLFYEILNEVSH